MVRQKMQADCAFSLLNGTDQLENCIFSRDLLQTALEFNATDCITDIYAYTTELSYYCLFYYLHFYDDTDNSTVSCVEFRYASEDVFHSVPCESISDRIADMLNVKDLSDPNGSISFTLSILFFFYFARNLVLLNKGG
jgi:hypothetical protein